MAQQIEIAQGDALDVFRNVRGLASIVTDPPGGGHFMGLKFDASHGGRDKWVPYWAERFKAARLATDRGLGLFWSFPRTAHWTACALDDAGWEIVGSIEHIHGQGWNKSNRTQLKPAKEIWWLVRWGGALPLQIDRCRVVRAGKIQSTAGGVGGYGGVGDAYEHGTGREYRDGSYGSWPTDLVLSHCSACREVGTRKVASGASGSPVILRNTDHLVYGADNRKPGSEQIKYASPDGTETVPALECLAACECGLTALVPAGGSAGLCEGCGSERWWACPVAELDGQSGFLATSGTAKLGKPIAHKGHKGGHLYSPMGSALTPAFADEGGASRFFPTFLYDAKASRTERQAGCEHLLWIRDKHAPIGWRRTTQAEFEAVPKEDRATGNVHATIKPVGLGPKDKDGLMRWLVRLITPPGERVGDICLGSGSTALAALREGHGFTGCDVDVGAVDIANARLTYWHAELEARAGSQLALAL